MNVCAVCFDGENCQSLKLAAIFCRLRRNNEPKSAIFCRDPRRIQPATDLHSSKTGRNFYSSFPLASIMAANSVHVKIIKLLTGGVAVFDTATIPIFNISEFREIMYFWHNRNRPLLIFFAIAKNIKFKKIIGYIKKEKVINL